MRRMRKSTNKSHWKKTVQFGQMDLYAWTKTARLAHEYAYTNVEIVVLSLYVIVVVCTDEPEFKCTLQTLGEVINTYSQSVLITISFFLSLSWFSSYFI